jgi:outer membrane protein TolC
MSTLRRLLLVVLITSPLTIVRGQSPEATPSTPPAADTATTPAADATLTAVVPTTLQELLLQALQANLEIQARRLEPQISDDRITGALGAFDPAVSFGGLYETSERALNQRDFLSTGQISRIYQEDNERYQASVGGRLSTGTMYELLVDNARLDNTYNRQAVSLYGPEFQSNFVLRLTQPLLRDFGPKANMAEVRLARNARNVSESEFRASVLRVIGQTMSAYFEAVFAQENIRVKDQAITLAENLRRENARRSDEGTMAQIDVIQAQARVSEAKEERILAQNLLTQRRNTLKELTKGEFDFDSPAMVFATENVQLPIPNLDRDTILSTVFTKNPSYLAALEGAKAEDIRLAYAKNQRWPRVDLKATYGFNGLGVDTKDSFDDFSDRSQPDWSVGVAVTIPIANRAARGRLGEAQKRQVQAALNVKRAEVTILSAVDTAMRDIDAARERVALVKDTVGLAKSALDAELRRLENGLTTSYNVLSLQKELSQARSRELATIVDLNKAITTLLLLEGTLAEKMDIAIVL